MKIYSHLSIMQPIVQLTFIDEPEKFINKNLKFKFQNHFISVNILHKDYFRVENYI